MVLAFTILKYTIWGINILISLAGVAGAAQCAATREDAFDAAGRQQKWIWVAILLGSALACFTGLSILAWVGIVLIGIYWFDVRPQIRDILNGVY